MSRRGRWAYLVQHYSELNARARPNACAVRSSRGDSLTYEDLARRSSQLAHALMAAGVGRQCRVALCLARGVSSVVAMLGVLKSDAIYVPIHEKSPVDRCRTILQDCRPSAIIVDRGSVPRILEALETESAAVRLLVLGEPPADPSLLGEGWIGQEWIDRQPGEQPVYHNVDRDIAHILYTSGSTGRPKGVMISHLNVINYIEWAVDYFGLGESDRILGTAPFHFDMSTFDLYCSQKAGATLCLATEEDTLFPSRLVQLMEQEGITVWKGVASLLAYLARTGAVQPGRLPTLTRVLFSGERLPTRVLTTWMQAFPGKRFFNVYGPTEATGISTAFPVGVPPESVEVAVPIGRPCANSEVIVLTEGGQTAELDEVGEICIRGSSLSPGYWRDPERTREAFVENPVGAMQDDRIYRTGDLGFWGQDGELRLVGRRDEQVKWMGYRIELGEIAVSIQALPEVEEAAVMLLPDRTGESEQLVAFVVSKGDGSGAILGALRQRLPVYMVPKRVLPLSSLPRSDRGKVDRDALKRIYLSSNPA